MVGDDDLIARILESGGGGLQFDKCIATPDMMPRLSKVGWAAAGAVHVANSALAAVQQQRHGEACSRHTMSRSSALTVMKWKPLEAAQAAPILEPRPSRSTAPPYSNQLTTLY